MNHQKEAMLIESKKMSKSFSSDNSAAINEDEIVVRQPMMPHNCFISLNNRGKSAKTGKGPNIIDDLLKI